jgi:hypothetical protein
LLPFEGARGRSEALQPRDGLLEHLVLLAESEADQATARVGVVVEDGVGDRDHAAALGDRVLEGACADVGEVLLRGADRRDEGRTRGAQPTPCSLSVEFIDDVDRVRPGILQRTSRFSRHLREALEYLLRERPCNVIEWGALTGVAFWDDAHLYAYLQDLYDYFYGERSEPPVAPDPEAPMPDWSLMQ